MFWGATACSTSLGDTAPEVAASSTPESAEREVAKGHRAALVVVPGVTGSALKRADGRIVWGTGRRLLWPRDRGREIALPIDGEGVETTATSALWVIRLAGIQREIYRPLRGALEQAGYRFGDARRPGDDEDLYFFPYDWRRDNVEAASELHRFLERLVAARGDPRIDLLCQSNAGRICRYLVRFGDSTLAKAESGETGEPRYRVEKLLLIGASNGGSLRQLRELNRGRRYLPLGRYLAPETVFTIRPLFSDLPSAAESLFLDPRGRPLAVDLYDPESWRRFGWSVFRPRIERRLKDDDDGTYGDPDSRLAYLSRQLDRARREQRLLAGPLGDLRQVRYYLLENSSRRTPTRAVIVPRKDGRGYRTLFAGDPRVDRDPRLRRQVSEPGDGHASLESQRTLSGEEKKALTGVYTVAGGHFETIVEPDTHRKIVAILLGKGLGDA